MIFKFFSKIFLAAVWRKFFAGAVLIGKESALEGSLAHFLVV